MSFMTQQHRQSGLSLFRHNNQPQQHQEGTEPNNNAPSEVVEKENPAACIFVASLNKNVDNEELNVCVFNHFKRWGKLLGVKVLKDWLKRPYAFVQYESVQDSNHALQEAPGTFINGRSIRCEPARVNRSICLISLNHPYNKKFLQTHLSVYGELEDVTILQPHGKFHYVFVKFKYREDAVKAYLVLKANDKNGLENQWCVEWASNLDVNNIYGGLSGSILSRTLDKFTVFVGNLNESTTEADLMNEFQSYGTIDHMQLIQKPFRNTDQAPKKVYAFIKYKNQMEAAMAIDHENGKLWNGKIIRVCYRQYYHNYCASQSIYNVSNGVVPTCYCYNSPFVYNNNVRYDLSIAQPDMGKQRQHNDYYVPYYNTSATNAAVYDPSSHLNTLFHNSNAASTSSSITQFYTAKADNNQVSYYPIVYYPCNTSYSFSANSYHKYARFQANQ